MKGKFFTVIGIVLLFGYFIMESLKAPSDPTQVVVMVGNDTLGRDWGAQADERDREIARQNGLMVDDAEGQNGGGSGANASNEPTNLLSGNDPLERDRSFSGNYSTIQSVDGREIITGTYGDNDYYDNEQQNTNYKTRHQQERESRNGSTNTEPSMIYRE